MPDFKTVSPKDNPHPEREEQKRQQERDRLAKAQSNRDQAELNKQRAREGRAASEDDPRDEIEAAAKIGGGPAGLNKGPSDTVSRDPHNPNRSYPPSPVGGAGRPMETPGMGFSPPTGAAPTSDRPEPRIPAVERAGLSGSEEAQAQGKHAQQEHDKAIEAERQAQRDLDKAGRDISREQSPGSGSREPNPSGGGQSYPETPEQRREREDRERRDRQGSGQGQA